MESECCKSCKSYLVCELKKSLPFLENGCSDYFFAKKKKYVALEQNLNTKNWIILGFSDSRKELMNIVSCRPGFEKNFYRYLVIPNLPVTPDELNFIKDKSLLNICETVAFVLSRAEYHMLKHRYTKSKFCFDKIKKQIVDACLILDNY